MTETLETISLQKSGWKEQHARILFPLGGLLTGQICWCVDIKKQSTCPRR